MKKTLAMSMATLALTLGGLGLSATPAAPVIQKAEAAAFTSCYTSIFGDYWCYRYGCTDFERLFYRCYNGWVKINRPWYA